MKKVTLAVLVSFVTASALPVLADQLTLSASVENQINRAVVQYEGLESPFEIFTRKIQEIKQPQAAPLMETLQLLTAYNQIFETETDTIVLRRWAAKLEGPIAVPWNTYRGNGLKEIFDNYIPNSHGNRQLAQLEYYVKFFTLPQKAHDRTYLVSKILPSQFMQSYTKLTDQLAAQHKRNNKELVKMLAQFIPAYNKLTEQDPILAQELKESLFLMPIQTGWDRTFSVQDLVFQLGLNDVHSEGRAVSTAEQIQDETGVDLTDAQLLASFTRQLRIR